MHFYRDRLLSKRNPYLSRTVKTKRLLLGTKRDVKFFLHTNFT